MPYGAGCFNRLTADFGQPAALVDHGISDREIASMSGEVRLGRCSLLGIEDTGGQQAAQRLVHSRDDVGRVEYAIHWARVLAQG